MTPITSVTVNMEISVDMYLLVNGKRFEDGLYSRNLNRFDELDSGCRQDQIASGRFVWRTDCIKSRLQWVKFPRGCKVGSRWTFNVPSSYDDDNQVNGVCEDGDTFYTEHIEDAKGCKLILRIGDGFYCDIKEDNIIAGIPFYTLNNSIS